MKASQMSNVHSNVRTSSSGVSQKPQLNDPDSLSYIVSKEIPKILLINSWNFQAWLPYCHSWHLSHTHTHTLTSPLQPPPTNDIFFIARQHLVFPDLNISKVLYLHSYLITPSPSHGLPVKSICIDFRSTQGVNSLVGFVQPPGLPSEVTLSSLGFVIRD